MLGFRVLKIVDPYKIKNPSRPVLGHKGHFITKRIVPLYPLGGCSGTLSRVQGIDKLLPPRQFTWDASNLERTAVETVLPAVTNFAL